MTIKKVYLKIWGVPLGFGGFSEAELQAVRAEFAGAVTDIKGPELCHAFLKIPGQATLVGAWPLRARHRGGSSGDKRYLNGEVFYGNSQNRDISVIYDGLNSGAYADEGSHFFSTSTETFVVGISMKHMLLLDLVEAFLLEYARRNGWLQCHSAGWLRDGQVTLAIGASGAGKTTQLFREIGQDGVLLGNDRIFLRLDGDRLEARGYPLSMNVGCGTIRALGLNFNDFGGADRDKIRLTPVDVADQLPFDFEGWWQVGRIFTPDAMELKENLYFKPDPCHPMWNAAWNTPFNKELALTLIAVAEERATYGNLFQEYKANRC